MHPQGGGTDEIMQEVTSRKIPIGKSQLLLELHEGLEMSIVTIPYPYYPYRDVPNFELEDSDCFVC